MGIRTRRGSASEAKPFEFFKGFLRNPREVGSVIPSSRFLIRRVLKAGEVSRARVILELGPGTGVLTREILRAMPPASRLIAVELMPRFARLLRRELDDPRLLVYEGSSAYLRKALAEAGVRPRRSHSAAPRRRMFYSSRDRRRHLATACSRLLRH